MLLFGYEQKKSFAYFFLSMLIVDEVDSDVVVKTDILLTFKKKYQNVLLPTS